MPIFATLIVLGFSLPIRADQRDPAALAAQVDHRIATRWSAAKVMPNLAADDATFARRVSLDLADRMPSAAEVRTFLDDTTPEKRAKLVARRALWCPELHRVMPRAYNRDRRRRNRA